MTLKSIRHRFYSVLALGIVWPWMVGLTVKIWLMLQGEPTMPLLYFLHPGGWIGMILISMLMGVPYVVLLALSLFPLEEEKKLLGFEYGDRVIVLSCCALVGMVSTTPFYWGLFKNFDPLGLLFPVTVLHLQWYALGFGIGLLLAVGRVWWRARLAA